MLLEDIMDIRISGTVSESIVDGPGFRYTIFVQGCPHNCPGCHNPQTHDFEGGRIFDTDELFRECVDDPLNKGVTFSGGEPFSQAKELYELGKRFKERGYDLWCYTGWTMKELWKMAESEYYVGKLMSIIDVLVDGRFIEERKTLALPFRGSENQRLINMKMTLKENMVIEYNL